MLFVRMTGEHDDKSLSGLDRTIVFEVATILVKMKSKNRRDVTKKVNVFLLPN